MDEDKQMEMLHDSLQNDGVSVRGNTQETIEFYILALPPLKKALKDIPEKFIWG